MNRVARNRKGAKRHRPWPAGSGRKLLRTTPTPASLDPQEERKQRLLDIAARIEAHEQRQFRWYLYRESPLRVLYANDLGFQEEPTPQLLSRLALKERKRWRVWLFESEQGARTFARALSRIEPTKMGKLRLRSARTITRVRHPPKRKNGLLELA
jgi:hypothetical protein